MLSRSALCLTSLVLTALLGACATSQPRYRTVEIQEASDTAAPAQATPASTPAQAHPAVNSRLPSAPVTPAQTLQPISMTVPATTAPQIALISECQINFEEKIAAALKAIEERKARI
jgi:hypothetical protein